LLDFLGNPSMRRKASDCKTETAPNYDLPQETWRGVMGDQISIILPALGIAFAASFVWLTVRIINRRERWAKRTAVALVVLLVYPLSFGPACWWLASPEHMGISIMRSGPPHKRASRIYWPMGWVAAMAPGPIRDAIFWYATRRSYLIDLPADYSGETWYGSEFYGR
jgi:hypothetical protein